MLRNLTIIGALLICVYLAPQAFAGSWGFIGQTFSNGDVMCSGEVNSPHLPGSCDLTSSGGVQVATSDFGGFCAASIWCGNVIKTCLTADTRSSRGPVMCFAVGFATGAARAECKSDHGNFELHCSSQDLQSPEDESAGGAEEYMSGSTGVVFSEVDAEGGQ